MSDPNNHEYIFDLVSHKDDAQISKGLWLVESKSTSYNCQAHKTHHTCMQRWTQNNNKKRNEGGIETQSDERDTDDNLNSGRAINQPGWHSEGLEFYEKRTKFFNMMRVEENEVPHPQFVRLKSETRDWFYTGAKSKKWGHQAHKQCKEEDCADGE